MRIVVACLIVGAAMFLMRPGAWTKRDSKAAASESAVLSVQREWRTDLAKFKEGSELADIDSFMKGKIRDRAELLRGGSGHRTVYYKIDDFLDAYVDADRFGKTVREPGVTRAGRWLKGPEGRMEVYVAWDEKEEDIHQPLEWRK